MNKTTVTTHASRLRAGVARCDITPPVGIYHRMWGAATHDRATGVHRPLTATALLLAPAAGDDIHAFVALDHCLFWGPEMANMLRSVSRATGLPEEQLTFCFSHTHAAGLMGLERAKLPGGDRIAPYLDETARKIATLIDEARRSLEPTTITYGVARCTLAGQRDYRDDTSGQIVCGFNPEGDADDAVLVARLTGPDGETRATLVNYACHPTTLAFANTLISPDFVGALREIVERDTHAPCLFLQGASGDLGPREGFLGDTAVADRNGRQLGYAALEAITLMPPPDTDFVYAGPVVSGATLGIWEHRAIDDATSQRRSLWNIRRFTVALPYRADLPQRDETEAELRRWQTAEHEARDEIAHRDAHAMVERMTRRLTRIAHLPAGPEFPLQVVLLRTGDAVLVAVEGEHYQYLQRQLREKFPDVPVMVTTLANGSRCSYLPTADTYGKGIYQEEIAVLAAGSLETLTERLAVEIKASVEA